MLATIHELISALASSCYKAAFTSNAYWTKVLLHQGTIAFRTKL